MKTAIDPRAQVLQDSLELLMVFLLTKHRDCVFSPSKLPDSFPDATPNFAKIFTAFTGGGGNRQSEGCLTLNIWTKGTWDSKMPVLVFIHGGRMVYPLSLIITSQSANIKQRIQRWEHKHPFL